MRKLTGSGCVSDDYITCCHRRLGSVGVAVAVGVSSVPVAVGDRIPAEWELAPDRGLGPSATHGWAAQLRWRRSAAVVARRTLGQYVTVCLRLQLTTHTLATSTLSNKVWEVYFYKEVRSFVRSLKSSLLFTMSPLYICICIFVKFYYSYTTRNTHTHTHTHTHTYLYIYICICLGIR